MNTREMRTLLAQAALATADEFGGRDRCWGSMLYACNGRRQGDGYDLEPCGHSERYYLGIGVEGPKSIRRPIDEAFRRADTDREESIRAALEAADGRLTIPCAFYAGPCRSCYGGGMVHTNFAADEEYLPDEWRIAPSGKRYFRVPDVPSALMQFVHGGYSTLFAQAELVVAP